jgi:soluble lytic murein transglycosylase-like protein
MKFFAPFCCLLIFFAATQANAEIQIRIDEKGRKVFFNPAPKILNYKFTATQPLALTYSKRANDYTPMIETVCNKYSVDPKLVKAVIQVESAYNSNALSRAGAIGLMQLMPATASRFGVKEIRDPQENIHGGVKYLRFLLDRFDNDLTLAVAAYNAGEGAVDRFQGVPRYAETQNYVRKVLSLYGNGEFVHIPERVKVEPPKSIYKYVDSKGVVHFTTERPSAGAVNEIKLIF